MPRKPRVSPEIHLTDGRILWPRVQEAENNGVCDKTVRLAGVATTYAGGVAYCVKGAYGEAVAAKLRSRNEPTKARRAGGRS